ncbi:zincin-like metallopeptidase domain-containing protein [Legionella fairfieldensis]|uniref:zincin-like metallopeptidase domain-containing protein n=1 Tax=Legionella fairfieldensis TaxID=45064 RepID=UPI000560EFB5|nr:zincin-like metallopeptidase domain-containing protein [Legionella fairfieldensis]
MNKTLYHEVVAEKIIALLKKGCAPWQCPFEPGEAGILPFNPITEKRYKGINAIQLMAEEYSDPRWMTYKQAMSVDAQVRKGEKGCVIQYWKFTDLITKKDDYGNPILDANGNPKKIEVHLERPRIFYATVFNAEQIDGLPSLVHKEKTWHSIERAEYILDASGAVILHNGGSRAFYRPGSDTIHLPLQNQFQSAHNYYATALHELGHWTGHSSRLDRDLTHPFGSEGYAKEELRAEITSMILGEELSIGHDPAQHAAYVGSWINLLKNDPLELFRAAADAEKAQHYILSFEQKLIQEQTTGQTRIGEQPLVSEQLMSIVTNSSELSENSLLANTSSSHEAILETKTQAILSETLKNSTEKQWLHIPFNQKETAKQLAGVLPNGQKAIEWDKSAKSWFAHPGTNLDKLTPWLLNHNSTRQGSALAPQEEFAETLKSLGCLITGNHPIMDGRPHRISTEGDKGSEKAGFYIGHLDGHPAGYVKNNRTGVEIKWKSKGYVLSDEQKEALQSNLSSKFQARLNEQSHSQEQAALRVSNQVSHLTTIKTQTPYLRTKEIAIHSGIFTDEEGKTTYIPAYDVQGKQWTMQYIKEDGTKRFAKNSRKEGCFHVIGGLDALSLAPILIIAEGYATAASLTQASGVPVVSAFDSGNLTPVAKALHEKFPNKPILIAGDNDFYLEKTQGINPGKTKAKEAAAVVNGQAVFPIFAPGEQPIRTKGLTDFNDMATKSVLGQEGVKRQVNSVIEKIVKEHSLVERPRYSKKIQHRDRDCSMSQ